MGVGGEKSFFFFLNRSLCMCFLIKSVGGPSLCPELAFHSKLVLHSSRGLLGTADETEQVWILSVG